MPFDNPHAQPQVKESTEHEYLRKMLDIPWCQNTFQRGRSMCLIGSLSYAANAGDARVSPCDWPRSAKKVRSRLARLAKVAPIDLEWWNDHPERTEDDVRALVRLAISTF